MKKLLALMLAMVMVLSLAACGGEEEYEEPAEDEAYEEEAEYAEDEEEYAEGEEEYTEDSFEGADDPVSDEHFADLQDSFAQLAQLYDQVVELYSADEIAADETINENLSKTKDIMVTMAGITKESLTEGDALKLMESMGYLAEALGMIVEDMQAA